MEVTTAINRMSHQLAAGIAHQLRPYRITFPQYEALVLLLFSHDGVLPLSSMRRRLMIHPATVTNTINQLESKGLVERLRDDGDRRVVFAKLTPPGRDIAIAASETLVESKFGLSEMTDVQAQAIASALADYRRRPTA
jgi:DNA-binding MarR family transcriptional regulator